MTLLPSKFLVSFVAMSFLLFAPFARLQKRFYKNAQLKFSYVSRYANIHDHVSFMN